MNPIKIGFVLLSRSRCPAPSTRISVLNMLPFLQAGNFHPEIVFEAGDGTETPDVSGLVPRLLDEGFQIVYFQKVHGPSVEALARQLSVVGVKTVYGVCDRIKPAMAEATDVTITVTDYLKSLYPPTLQPKIRVVHDGIEHAEICKTNWGLNRGSRNCPLRAVLVTSSDLDRLPVLGTPPNWLEVTIVGCYPSNGQVIQHLRQARWKLDQKPNLRERLSYLRFLMNRRIRCQAWDLVGVYETMQQADIGIIPVDTPSEHAPDLSPPFWKVKSENRLTMKMCMGLPVIATPIPAYEAVVNQGENGFLARSQDEWIKSLNALRDPMLRRIIGEQARVSVMTRYSMQEQARRLIEVLRGLFRAQS